MTLPNRRRRLLLPLMLLLLCGLSTAADLPNALRAPLPPATREGWNRLLKGRPGAAAESFRDALAADARQTEARAGLEIALIELGRYEEAAAEAMTLLGADAWTPWMEVAADDLNDLLDDVRDLPRLEQSLARLAESPQQSWLQRSLTRHLLAEVRLRLNRIEGATAALAPEPYIRQLFALGPFENRSGAAFSEPNDLEQALPQVDLAAKHPGRGRAVGWHPLPAPWNGLIDLTEVLTPGRESYGYVLAHLQVQEETDASLIVGCAGASALWLDGVLLYRDTDYGLGHPFQRVLPLRLQPGAHQILLKSGCDDASDWSVRLRVVPLPPRALLETGSAARADQAKSIAVLSEPDAGALPAMPGTTARADEPGEEAGLFWGAQAHFRQVLADVPQDVVALVNSGYLHLTRGTGGRAFRHAGPLLTKAAELAPAFVTAQALASLVQKDENRSRVLLETAAANEAARSAAEMLLRTELNAGRIAQAESRARRLLETGRSASALLALGRIAADRGWGPEAILQYDAALAVKPSWLDALDGRLQLTREPGPRLAFLRRMLPMAGHSRTLRSELGTLLQQAEHFDEAAALYGQERILWPYISAAWLDEADCLRSQGKTEEAAQLLLQALRWLPEHPDLLEALGRFELEAGRTAEALEHFERVLVLRSDHPELAALVRQLQPEQTAFYDGHDIRFAELEGKDATADDHPLHNVLGLLDQGFVKVHANGTRSKMIHTVMKVLRPGGIRQCERESIGYDPERQTVRVVRAAVIQPDGTVLDKARIAPRERSGAMGGGVYGSHSVMEIRLPQVQEGSIVDIQYTVEDTAPNDYLDAFEEGFFFGSVFPVVRFDYVLDLPESLAVRHGQAHIDNEPQEKVAGERRILHWSARNLPGTELEPRMPPQWEYVPSLRASTFRDWNDVGRWYWDLSRKAMELPADIRSDVLNLRKEAENREAVIEAVYDWITRNIRYVSISFGTYGCTPHEAERTWRGRYGDCKDTAVLFCAMLNELGIEARVALIRTNDRGIEPTGVPGAFLFNHAIAFVPDDPQALKAFRPGDPAPAGIWLDGTTDFHAMRELPDMDQGAMALITGPEGGLLVTTPVDRPEDNRTHQDLTFTLLEGGQGRLNVFERTRGAMAPPLRQHLQTPEKLRQGIEQVMTRLLPGSRLTSFDAAPTDLQTAPTMRLELEAPHLAQPAGEGEFRFRPGLMPIQLSRQYAVQRTRRHDLMLDVPLQRMTTVSISLPAGAELRSLPRDLQVEHPFGSYRRTAALDGDVVRIENELTLSVRRIAASDYASFKEFCHTVDSACEEQVVYRVR